MIVIAACLLILPSVALAETPPAPVPKTGQATPYKVGDDGDLKKGVAWPDPRFSDNSDGTVTDNLTGLIWLRDANCFGAVNWDTALANANALAAPYPACSLTDPSKAGDWRLPNIRELSSLVDASTFNPAISTGHPFLNVQTDKLYQSSTTDPLRADFLLAVSMTTGSMNKAIYGALNYYYFWPVRGPQ
jgi:hypothetical protein